MDKRKRVREEVEETMALMDQMETLDPGPYFYTRVEARLRGEEREARVRLLDLLGSRILKPALLALLLLINLFSAVYFLVEPREAAPPDETYSSYASEWVQEYWPSQDSYDVSVMEKMTGGSES
jgi:hypothetical protein